MSGPNATDPGLFGHVTPWSSQLGIVFGLYASVAVVCSLVRPLSPDPVPYWLLFSFLLFLAALRRAGALCAVEPYLHT